MDKIVNYFNPVNTELLKGINLIEASAGTGKTYTIAMLLLRFVVEQNRDIKKILVVTFTKAATEELKDRIRDRLVTCRLAILGQKVADQNLEEWLDTLSLDSDLILQRINNALLDIDQAGIFTIHGFCQRVLSEHALESGQLFDSELSSDTSAIKQACSDDFWRKNITGRSKWEVSLLSSQYQTPDQLLASVNFIDPTLTVFPEYHSLDKKLDNLSQIIETQKDQIIHLLTQLKHVLDQGKFKKTFSDQFNQNQQLIPEWLNGQNTTLPDFSELTEQGLINALNGHKFRKSKANPLTSEEQKQTYISKLGINIESVTQVDSAINQINLYLRRALLQTLQEDVTKKLEQLNLLSFDDLITRFSDALKQPNNSILCQEIQKKYDVALIDEFQDTDQNQWFIFSTLFSSEQHSLYLIGDPKQAIYKFRGADINSYFSAQKQAQHHFTLDKNWRSHPLLVNAINLLFKKANPFFCQQLNFNPVVAALSSKQGQIIEDQKTIPPLILCQLDENSDKLWTAGKATDEIITSVCNEILDLLQNQFHIQKDKVKQTVLPKDIAILVRSNDQAKKFQQALNQSNITAVINSRDSVFASAEAINLHTLLRAIAQPANHALAKQALTLPWFKINGQQLSVILNDETAMDYWLTRFQTYHLNWQNNGLMAMIRQLISEQNFYANLATAKQSERSITNLQHCIELLQQSAIDEHLGINKTVDWLHINIVQSNSGRSSDEQQLRLESDDNAVQIITMHSSKGLEYPIVFCPFLWQRGGKLVQESLVIKCHSNQQMIVDLGSEKFEYHRSLALEEELAEDLRVFYVAVTRAKFRCYISWADVRTKEKPNNSAMAYLLDFGLDNFQQQQEKLIAYSQQLPSAIEYRLLPSEQELSRTYQSKVSNIQLQYLKRNRKLQSNWQMSSYSALTAFHSNQDVPELPDDKAREETIDTTEVNYSELPKGNHTGNVIHDLLENIPFKLLYTRHDISSTRDNACRRYGLKTEKPDQIDKLLKQTVSTLMSDDATSFCLNQLNEHQCLKEMPFYLSMNPMDISKINHVLDSSPDYQPLSEKQMSGFLTGFIDLVCQYDDKYYVIDYKSNYLPDYHQETLLSAMKEHNYGLQYWIYTLVLHQYLKLKLPKYNYHQHIGGVKYLFVRGMDKNSTNSGVYQTRPELEKLEILSSFFNSFN